jgi:hypothetical protein
MWGILPHIFNNGDVMKRDKNFKLSKEVKRILATIVDPIQRSGYKNCMIDAQLASSVIVKSKKTKETS